MNLLILTQKIDKNDSNLGFFHRWLEEFAKNCEKLTVICLYRGEYSLPENVKVLSLGKEKGVCRLKYLFSFYKYIFKYRKEYDSVFVHMNQIYIILGGFWWKMMNKKIALWYAHGGVSSSLEMAEKITDIIFTSTPSGFRLKSNKTKIVGQGIDANIFKPNKEKRDKNIFKIITVGRISPVKDYETLISAVELIKNKINNLRIDIVGDACTENDKKYLLKLKEMVKIKNLENIINFVGPLINEKVVSYLQSSNLFVNMSYTGSLDKAILEAMSCGCLVLTCNEAFLALDLEDKGNLMFTKSDFQELADKILKHYSMSEIDRNNLESYLSANIKENFSLYLLINKIIKNYALNNQGS